MRTHGGEVSPVTAWSTFRADVEGLRAVAVLLVVGFHYGVTFLAGGFIGVDVFFVISGFVITRMLRSELAERRSIDLIRFYGRRARRLLPASLTMIIVTLVASTELLSPLELKDVSKAAAASSLYVSNFWFMDRASDYFAPESGMNPFLHTWTLAVEEQFYLFWPALLMFSAKFKGRGQIACILILLLGSFAAGEWVIGTNQPVAFYASPLRAWEFALGAFVTYVPRVRCAAFIAAAGALAIAFSAVSLSSDSTFPGLNALPPTLGTAALLIAGERRNSVSSSLELAPLQWLGKLSYSIYLCHWPIIVLGRAAFAVPDARLSIECAAISLIIAWVSFTFLEHPVRVNSWLIAKRRRSVGLAASLTLAGAVASASFWIIGAAEARESDQLAIQAAATETSALPDRCIVGFTDATPVDCKFYKGLHTVVLFGDSHARQLFTPISLMARAQKMQLVTYFKASCAVADVTVFNNRLHRLNPECTRWRNSVIERLQHHPPETIIISQSSMGYVTGVGRSGGTITIPPDAWYRGLVHSLRELVGTGANVLVIQDSPRMTINVPVCLARAVRRGRKAQSCNRPRNLAVDDGLGTLEQRASNAAGARYVRTMDLYCSATECPAMSGKTVLYRDGNHLSEGFARALTPRLSERIRPLESIR